MIINTKLKIIIKNIYNNSYYYYVFLKITDVILFSNIENKKHAILKYSFLKVSSFGQSISHYIN